MENDEGLNPSQPAVELELEPQAPQQEPQGGDPLDEIQDIGALKYIATTLPAFSDEHKGRLDTMTDREEVLGEVKKIRGISNRIVKKVPKQELPAKPLEPKQPDSSQFLTKADYERSNEKKAIREVTADAFVKDNWDGIRQFYTPRRGKDTPEDILEDIKDAVVVFKARNPEKPDNGVAQLSQTAVTQGTGGSAPRQEQKPKDPPNFKLPTQPSSWYPKKES